MLRECHELEISLTWLSLTVNNLLPVYVNIIMFRYDNHSYGVGRQDNIDAPKFNLEENRVNSFGLGLILCKQLSNTIKNF